MKRWAKIDGRLSDYVDANWLREDDVKRRLREETARMRQAGMQISAHQGQQLALLARAIGARRAIEVGTFTGYSTLCLARGLSDGGRVIACDVSEEWTAIARRYWEKAGVAEKIELRIAPAAQTLGALSEAPDFDLAFIDADKPSYPIYYELILPRLRSGG